MTKRLYTLIGSPLSQLFTVLSVPGYLVGICGTCVKGVMKSTFSSDLTDHLLLPFACMECLRSTSFHYACTRDSKAGLELSFGCP